MKLRANVTVANGNTITTDSVESVSDLAEKLRGQPAEDVTLVLTFDKLSEALVLARELASGLPVIAECFAHKPPE